VNGMLLPGMDRILVILYRVNVMVEEGLTELSPASNIEVVEEGDGDMLPNYPSLA